MTEPKSPKLDKSPSPSPSPIVEMTGISIAFPGVKALDAVDFRLLPGEVHALMGENGAGKSTLIKALTGVYGIDAGRIVIDGADQVFAGPAAAQAAGISTVYQEVNLTDNLSVAENVMLGHEIRRFGVIDWRATRKAARTYLQALNLDIDPKSSLSSHSLAVQQLVAISRAMVVDARVLILDEPTSSLDSGEVARLFDVIRTLRDRGVAILFVSHFLDQIYAISDRITVLRNGTLVGEYRPAELPRVELVGKMIGRTLEVLTELEANAERAVVDRSGTPFMQAVGVGRRGSIEPFDLDIYPGEIVGLAGLLGSGRTELARLISGIDRADTGELSVDGDRRQFHDPRQALRAGIAYSSESRKTEGIIGELSVRENITLALQAERGWLRRIPRARQEELSASWIEALDIRPADPERPAGVLSGGNQQKVMLARLLALAPRLLVLDEPTRGIDVGAKVEIQRLISDLASTGMAVIFISAELEEVLRVGHRIIVLRDREIVATLDPDTVTFEMLLAIVAKADGDE